MAEVVHCLMARGAAGASATSRVAVGDVAPVTLVALELCQREQQQLQTEVHEIGPGHILE